MPWFRGPLRKRMGKKVAIVQSSYIPWKGYFDLINSVDEFILFDDVQYTRRDWRNRNKIKTPRGSQWISIPVKAKGNYNQQICDMEVADGGWTRSHWEAIRHNYARASFFSRYRELLERLFLGCRETRLSGINRHFLESFCELLDIKTPITWSMDYESRGVKSEKLLTLCRAAGADAYLSGPSARAYMDEDLFAKEGVRVEYMDYSGYPEYGQVHPPFDHFVSVVDLVLNQGPEARRFMKSF